MLEFAATLYAIEKVAEFTVLGCVLGFMMLAVAFAALDSRKAKRKV